MASKRCVCGCGKLIPRNSRSDRKYATDRCGQRAAQRRYRRRQAERAGERIDAKPTGEGDPKKAYIDRDESRDGRATARRGEGYERFLATPYPKLIADGRMAQHEVVAASGETPANVSRWMAAYHEDDATGRAREGWTGPDTTVQSALDDFETFCRRYWPDDVVTPFQVEWGDLISEALDTGGRLMLLAAQRHSKSETLIKYCVWRIARNPNIRIVWISQSQDLAKKAVGYILDILNHNEQLREEILGPGKEFRPPARNNMSWTAEEFTVGVRTKALKSPTMVAIGKGGSLLSRDADLIVCDDLQEHKHIRSPGMRESDAEWFFTDLMSRKMPTTGLAVIGSRQHLQDIYSEIIKRGDEWTIRVYPVHDPLCTLPEDDHDAHDQAGCMLWPEHYSHAYMQEQRAQQGEAYFQRNMMNNPKDDATVLVSANDIERCKDFERVVGERPRGVTRLIAGIDPADAKPVAGVLWGHEPGWGDAGRRHVIDTIEAEAGIRGGREILSKWRRAYGCTLFVVEKNMAQSWWQDTEIRDFCSREGVQIVEHYTSASLKWNDATGVTAMFGRMRTDPPSITLPYGDRDSQRKMDRLASTFLTFDPDFLGNKHADDDLVMAAWFPQGEMDRQSRSHAQKAVADYAQTSYPWRTAYVRRPELVGR